VIREVRNFFPDQPLPSDNEEAVMTETEQDEESMAETETVMSEDEDKDDSEYNEEADEDDWVPSTASSSNRNKTPKAKVIQYQSISAGSSRGKGTQKMVAERNRLSKLEQKMDDLVLDDPDDSVVILPATKSKACQRSSTDNKIDDDDVEMEISVAKKKKR
jgi:kinesin family member 20